MAKFGGALWDLVGVSLIYISTQASYSVLSQSVQTGGQRGQLGIDDLPNTLLINRLVAMGDDVPQADDLVPGPVGHLSKTVFIDMPNPSQMLANDLQPHQDGVLKNQTG